MVGLRRTARNFPRVDFTKTIPPYGGFGLNAGFVAGMRPSLWLRFADTGSVVDVMGGVVPTFSRNSIATVQDWEGIIRNVGAGEIRFQGLRRVQNQLFGSSENFTDLNWNRTASGIGSDGIVTTGFFMTNGMSACRLQTNLNGGILNADRSGIFQTNVIFGNKARIFSVWLQSNDNNTYRLMLRLGNVGIEAVITPTPQRFTLSAPASDAATSAEIRAYGAFSSFHSSNKADILVAKAQLEFIDGQSNTNPSEYVSVGNPLLSFPYHGCGVDGVQYFPYQNGNTVDANNVVHEDVGAAFPVGSPFAGYLAEGARTNLALQSEDFTTTWQIQNNLVRTANVLAAPDGNATADLLTNGALANSAIRQDITLVAGTTYTLSFFFKSGTATSCDWGLFDITGSAFIGLVGLTNGGSTQAIKLGTGTLTQTAYSNGWYRVTLTVVTSANTSYRFYIYPGSTSTVDGTSSIYVWGAQLEAASFASNYIPTAAAAVTRSSDFLSYSVANWFNANAGTILLRMQAAPGVDVFGSSDQYIGLDDGTANNITALMRTLTTNSRLNNRVGGVVDVDITTAGLLPNNTSAIVAARYATNNYAISVNGGVTVSDNTATIPPINRLTVGWAAFGYFSFGPIHSVMNYPYAFDDVLMQTLTTS